MSGYTNGYGSRGGRGDGHLESSDPANSTDSVHHWQSLLSETTSQLTDARHKLAMSGEEVKNLQQKADALVNMVHLLLKNVESTTATSSELQTALQRSEVASLKEQITDAMSSLSSSSSSSAAYPSTATTATAATTTPQTPSGDLDAFIQSKMNALLATGSPAPKKPSGPPVPTPSSTASTAASLRSPGTAESSYSSPSSKPGGFGARPAVPTPLGKRPPSLRGLVRTSIAEAESSKPQTPKDAPPVWLSSGSAIRTDNIKSLNVSEAARAAADAAASPSSSSTAPSVSFSASAHQHQHQHQPPPPPPPTTQPPPLPHQSSPGSAPAASSHQQHVAPGLSQWRAVRGPATAAPAPATPPKGRVNPATSPEVLLYRKAAGDPKVTSGLEASRAPHRDPSAIGVSGSGRPTAVPATQLVSGGTVDYGGALTELKFKYGSSISSPSTSIPTASRPAAAAAAADGRAHTPPPPPSVPSLASRLQPVPASMLRIPTPERSTSSPTPGSVRSRSGTPNSVRIQGRYLDLGDGDHLALSPTGDLVRSPSRQSKDEPSKVLVSKVWQLGDKESAEAKQRRRAVKIRQQQAAQKHLSRSRVPDGAASNPVAEPVKQDRLNELLFGRRVV